MSVTHIWAFFSRLFVYGGGREPRAMKLLTQ